MFIDKALIFSKNQKSDDELRAVMAAHPWAGVIHGYYKAKPYSGEWKDVAAFNTSCDAICLVAAVGVGRHVWMVDDDFRRTGWKSFSNLFIDYIRMMAADYQVHVVYYGTSEIEARFADPENVVLGRRDLGVGG